MLRIVKQPPQALGQGLDILGRKEEARLAVQHGFADAAHVRGHDRKPGEHRFDRRQREALDSRGEDERVEARQVAARLVSPADDLQTIRDAQLVREPRRAPRAPARRRRARASPRKLGQRTDCYVVALLGGQPSEGPDHRPVHHAWKRLDRQVGNPVIDRAHAPGVQANRLLDEPGSALPDCHMCRNPA